MGVFLGILLCLGVIIAVLLIIGLVMYNTLIRKKNEVNNAFASIDALLKKRYDLIPNLIATVQQYMKHERETLTQITEMRAKAVSGNLSPDQRIELETKLSKTLGGILSLIHI